MESDRMGAGIGSLAFENTSMVFPDGTEALQDISFTVGQGGFMTVVGPSG